MLSALKLVRVFDDHEQHQELYAARCLAVHGQAECSEEIRHSLLWLQLQLIAWCITEHA